MSHVYFEDLEHAIDKIIYFELLVMFKGEIYDSQA